MTHSMPTEADMFEPLRQELRRGTLILAVLGQLRTEHYGYTLRRALAQAGVEIDEGALYPMLRRLESQGLLTSEWREEEKRNKRFYRLSDAGCAVLDRLVDEWRGMNSAVTDILKGDS
jgi:PadR family transcriptional regulator PadR